MFFLISIFPSGARCEILCHQVPQRESLGSVPKDPPMTALASIPWVSITVAATAKKPRYLLALP